MPRLVLVWVTLLGLAGCAFNPPLERSNDRPREPQIRRTWEDAGPEGTPQTWGDAGSPRAADAGPGAIDAGAPDAGPPLTDAGPPALDCGQFAAVGYDVCGSFADACEIIFRDSSGCNAACARAGLVCEDSWNDEPGTCAPRRSEHLGCRENGFESIYCVCVRGTP